VGIVTRTDLLKIFVREDADTKALVEQVLAERGYLPPAHVMTSR
jgi:CBS domain-containing protein